MVGRPSKIRAAVLLLATTRLTTAFTATRVMAPTIPPVSEVSLPMTDRDLLDEHGVPHPGLQAASETGPRPLFPSTLK